MRMAFNIHTEAKILFRHSTIFIVEQMLNEPMKQKVKI